MITEMTPAQEQRMIEYRQEWLDRARRTDPIEQLAAEDAITAVYAQIGKPKPIIAHCLSPFSMVMMPSIYRELGKMNGCQELFSQLGSQLGSQLDSQLRSQLVSQLGSQLDSQLRSQLGSQLDSQLFSQLGSQLGSQLVSQLGSQLVSQLDSQLDSQLFSQLVSQLDSQLGSQLDSQLDSQLGSQLRSQLRSQLFSQLGSQLDSQLRSQLVSQLYSQLVSQLDSQLGSQLFSQLDSQLGSQLGSQLDSAKNDWAYWSGLFIWYYSDYLAWIEFPQIFEGFKYDRKQIEQWNEWIAVARNTHGFLAYDGICFVSDRPTKLSLDEQGRLHDESGPAVEYADGYILYSWHGVRIDWDKAYIIEHPEQITTALIEAEANAEVRRVMIERYSLERFIKDSGAQKIHSDDYGVLYRKELANDEPLVMVAVVNSTAEPDGSYRDYFLRVHPELRPLLDDQKLGEPQVLTARNAVAATFGMTGAEYVLAVQT
jgi:hypothetical protein